MQLIAAATLFITSTAQAQVVINEVDADTPGSDMLEFVELYDGGAGNTPLDGLTIVYFNGNGDDSYAAFDLDGFSTDVNGYFLLGNVGVPGVDLVHNTGLLQNGADAVALYNDDAVNFPNGTLVTVTNLVDALVYDTSDTDDPGLLLLLNPSEPQVDEGGGSGADLESNQRCPNGSGGARNTSTYVQSAPTPKGPCPTVVTTDILISEVDSDTPGTDSMEFVEIYDRAVGNSSLDGLVAVYFTGSTDSSYAAFDLDGYVTNSAGFFLIGNANVPGVDLVHSDNFLQNGADAVGLYVGNASDFPNGTLVHSVGLLDAVVYGTGDATDPGLLVLLHGGEPQVDEDAAGDQTLHSIQRCPSGQGGQRNTSNFIAAPPTPGGICTAPFTYCTGKTNSLGCVPFIAATGFASATDSSPFRIEAHDVLPDDFGVLLYAYKKFNLNFHNGKLCVKGPMRILPPKNSGSPGAPPCSGMLKRNFNNYIQSGIDPLLTSSQQVNCQYLSRDAALMDGFNDSLTNGLQFIITP